MLGVVVLQFLDRVRFERTILCIIKFHLTPSLTVLLKMPIDDNSPIPTRWSRDVFMSMCTMYIQHEATLISPGSPGTCSSNSWAFLLLVKVCQAPHTLFGVVKPGWKSRVGVFGRDFNLIKLSLLCKSVQTYVGKPRSKKTYYIKSWKCLTGHTIWLPIIINIISSIGGVWFVTDLILALFLKEQTNPGI